MSVEDTNDKWPCEYCTYLNFSTAIKCTLCRAPRSVSYGKSPDIYALAEQASGSTDDFIGNSDCALGKWSCGICTYLNWSRSLKCVQCQSSKSVDSNVQHNVPSSSGLSFSAPFSGLGACSTQLGPLPRTSQSPTNNVQTQVSSSERERFSPTSGVRSPGSPDPGLGSSSTLTNAKTASLDSQVIAKKLQKWTCGACTYENWPKTYRCTMCYSPRQQQESTLTQGTSTRKVSGTPSVTAPVSGGSSGHNSDGDGSAGGNKDKKRALKNSQGNNNGRKSPRNVSSTSSSSNESLQDITVNADATIEKNDDQQLRRCLRDIDWLFLEACKAVLGPNCDSVEAYFAAGGDIARALTNAEVHLLRRCGKFEPGHTLLHLAIKYHRDDILTLLLTYGDAGVINSAAGSSGHRVKRAPCHLASETASQIRRQIVMSLRQNKGDFLCYFFCDLTTFSLPAKVYDFPPVIQNRLFDELLDRDVQNELEEEGSIVNWSLELTDRLNSRLYPLWNRTAGDCLLDSVLQATWGVFDSENSLRQALADSLNDGAQLFYAPWKAYESSISHWVRSEHQWASDWHSVLQLAAKPGSALEQVHIFALAHIIRRPIIVYGVRLVKSFRGETIGYSNFQGIYLPFLWQQSFCWRSPICIGYTRGHFCALVPIGQDFGDLGGPLDQSWQHRHVYTPLTDSEGHLLPIHFLPEKEFGREEHVIRLWLDCSSTESGLFVCKMKLHRQPPLVQQMIDDWLDYYQRLAQKTTVPPIRSSRRSNKSSTTKAHPISTSSSAKTAARIANITSNEQLLTTAPGSSLITVSSACGAADTSEDSQQQVDDEGVTFQSKHDR